MNRIKKHLKETPKTEAPKHKESCDCAVCGGGNLSPEEMEERQEALSKWEQDNIEKNGYFIHAVGADSSMPYGINAHTHGLAETHDHPDLQLVMGDGQIISYVINTLVIEHIKKGKKFKDGDVIKNFANGYDIKFINATECDRPVLRIILADKKNKIEKDEIEAYMAKQYIV